MMTEDLDKRTEGQSEAQNPTEGGREGYRPASSFSGNRPTGRTPRPRIHTTQRAYTTRPTTPYSENGEATSADGTPKQASYQPRSSYQQQGGYQPRSSYQPRQQYRPRNNYNAEGYQPREGGYQSREGGYQPREGGYQPREGGYQPRSNYQPRQQYRPRYEANQEGGYQPRQLYRPRYEADQEGGYQPRQAYQPRQQSGYQSRGGYGQPRQQGGYGQPRPYGQQRAGGYQRGGYGQQRQQRGYNRPGYDPNSKYSLKKRIEYKEENIDPNEPIRLNKFLANAGICSRREADEFITAGAVTVNGQVVTELGTKVLRSDEVKFHDAPVSLEKKVYVLLNKPKDYVTTSEDPQQRKTVMDLVKDVCEERIYPVGRLDRNTTGVLLLTNDGDLASKLTHPKFLKKKVYHVFLDKNVTAHDMQQIAEGIELDDGEVHADAIEYASEQDKSQVGIEIHSGKNRIVRRIFEALGYRVIRLDRVQFAGLTKKNLRRGDWRFLTEKEVEMLRMGAFE